MPIYFTPPYSYLFLGLLIILLFLSKLIVSNRPQTTLTGKYSKKQNYLSPSELEAYQTIKNILPQGYVVFPQVNLDKIFDIVGSGGSYTPRNRIDRKSVDFVVFDSRNLTPVLAIELDDSSHLQYDRQKRDFMVNQLFIDTKSKLLRIKSDDVRDVDHLRQELIRELL